MAGELAVGLSRITPLLPAQTRRDLRRLLAHDLAAPRPERERAASLELLCELLDSGGGEVPTVEVYKAARHRRLPQAPAASTLSRRYGGWLRAVRAAAWLAAGGSGPPPAVPVRETQRPYDRSEALGAVSRCALTVGRQPSAGEYEEWARLSRRVARRSGEPSRTPGLSVLTRLFGSFDCAVRPDPERQQRRIRLRPR